MRAHSLLFVATIVGMALVGAPGCGKNDVPLNPRYSTDIKPLMEAHCIRCHGAGGMFNADPDMTAPIGAFNVAQNGDFTGLAPDAAGKNGLMFYTGAAAATMKLYVVGIGMPPPPADKLDVWDTEMLLRWCANPLP